MGNPAPQGSKRYLGTTKMGRGIVVETSNKTAPWRSDIIGACQRYRVDNPDAMFPMTGALVCRMNFNFWRPKSVTRAKRPFMVTAPDLDKLARGVLDPLQVAGIISNDSQVVSMTVEKVYINDPGSALDVPGLFLVLMPVGTDLEIGA